MLVVLKPTLVEQFLKAETHGVRPSDLVQHTPCWLLSEQYCLSPFAMQPLQSSVSHVHRSLSLEDMDEAILEDDDWLCARPTDRRMVEERMSPLFEQLPPPRPPVPVI